MRKMKRAITILLTLAFVLALLPVIAAPVGAQASSASPYAIPAGTEFYGSGRPGDHTARAGRRLPERVR